MFSVLTRHASRGTTRTLRAAHCCDYSTEVAAEHCETNGSPKTTHYRVTLFRSPIGLPKRRHDSLVSLGLRRRMDVSYHRHSPDAAGLILSVKELLKVENVTEEEVNMGKQSSRKLVDDDRGYRLIRNVLERN
ncbi:hypothetical protein PTTG_02349 [Puccinia triticina 1-1 BBBD Race 1]|uniref:Large ribosomal subunit protein uL30m n=2 Tax=Puccinia triticina TaxID=208348 RepID=A0A0C4ENK2_PUCT1|nr:uncharacterized protein PtA15_4A209 [Puccinia triticina]OAV99118.1 hypothetical protein PTTG_02349 [Puccinia triticina 1-1 BBBD Race 1]WAQ83761.1 hypothetical protein PtA15_4A209 [Puccinia triticina]